MKIFGRPFVTLRLYITLLSVSSLTMGVFTLLTRLPGGDKEMSDFSKLKIGCEEAIAFDAAGALNQFACHHAKDCMKGDYDGALKEWQTSLNHFVNIIEFKNYFSCLMERTRKPSSMNAVETIICLTNSK
jgi:hypothetical protein